MKDTSVPDIETTDSGWHIVLCEPNRELTAVSGMTARGFKAMCPADYIRRKTGRKDQNGRPVLSVDPTPKAMIPGYAFVQAVLSDPEKELVKKTPGVRGFFMVVNCEAKPDKADLRAGARRPDLKFAMLSNAQVGDLRLLDEMNFAKFQDSVRPKSERTPAVPFEAGKVVRVFCTPLGRDIYGQMVEKRGDGQIKIDAGHLSFVVPHFDVMETKGDEDEQNTRAKGHSPTNRGRSGDVGDRPV